MKTAAQINAAYIASQGTAAQSNARLSGESAGLRKVQHARPYLSKPNGALGTLWCECWHCGKARAVASGMNAETITTARVLEALIKIGWEVVPKFRCDGCVKYGNFNW